MKPANKRKRLLDRCEEIADGDKSIDLPDLKKLIRDSIKFCPNYNDEDDARYGNTNDRRKSLFVSLAIALTVRGYFNVEERRRNRSLKKLLSMADVKPSREHSNPSLQIVRLCIPDLHRRQQSRYAKAVERAFQMKLSPRKFYRILRPRDGNMAPKKKRLSNGMGLTAFIGY
jgi:hypothetical protein